jgi:hypothetical protein
MKLILAFTFALFTSSAIAAPASPPPSAPVDPNKQASVALSLADWQAVIASVGDSARVSARDANRITQTIVSQVQPQITATAPAMQQKSIGQLEAEHARGK